MARTRWTRPRLAQMAYLLGRGDNAKTIAEHPLVQSQPAIVHRYVSQMGLAFRDVPKGNVVVDLAPKVLAAVEVEARSRQQTPEALIKSLITICADDRHLFANILDDDA